MTNSCLKSGSGDWAEWTRDDVETCIQELVKQCGFLFGVYLYLFSFLYTLPNPTNRNMLASKDYELSLRSEKCEQDKDSDEMEVFGQYRPYKGEPSSHSSDDSEDTVVDEDGLSPAVLRSRFEGEVSLNKTGTRQCTRAVGSTFAETPGALIHYLGLLEFPVRICDASHITTHTRPTEFILWLRSLKTPGLLITFGTISVVSLSKRRIIELSRTAFIGFPFALMFTCTFTECITNIMKWYMSFGIFFVMRSRLSHLNFTRESSFKGIPLGWAFTKIFED